jgi:hypothetical protein
MLKVLSVLAVTIATAAVAHAASEPATTKRGPSNDPNEVVCVSQAQIGTRLNRRRVCRTRAEWAEHQAEHKQEVERAQQQMQTQFVDPGRPPI